MSKWPQYSRVHNVDAYENHRTQQKSLTLFQLYMCWILHSTKQIEKKLKYHENQSSHCTLYNWFVQSADTLIKRKFDLFTMFLRVRLIIHCLHGETTNERSIPLLISTGVCSDKTKHESKLAEFLLCKVVIVSDTINNRPITCTVYLNEPIKKSISRARYSVGENQSRPPGTFESEMLVVIQALKTLNKDEVKFIYITNQSRQSFLKQPIRKDNLPACDF